MTWASQLPLARSVRLGAWQKRISRSNQRALRVQKLVKADSRAKKLYVTGGEATQAYDAPIIGASPPLIRGMRRNAVLSVSKTGLCPCTTTIIAWRLDGECDLAVREPVKQIHMWMRLWSSMPAPARRDVRRAWRRAHPRILLNGVHWGSVTGVMQATIATIGQLGWIPTAPDKWLDESRTQYADLNDAAPEAGPQIVLAVRRSAQRAVWRKAAEHHLGRGLEEGVPSMEAARAAKKWLNRRHQKAEAKALDAIICGGLWHGERAGLQRICRCGKPETPYHRYWTCPKLDEIHDQGGRRIVSDTQWLEAEFPGPLGEHQCLWGRAILPASLRFPGQPVSKEQAEARYTHGFADAFAEPKTVYTDGSGGPRHAPKEAPTAGSGLASIVWGHDHGRPVAKHIHFAHAAVPGGQTVPRGELWAACAAARAAPSMIGARIMADATYIVDTLKDPERLGKARAKANGDLWAEYLEGVKEAGADFDAVKVKAHMEPKELLNGKANL